MSEKSRRHFIRFLACLLLCSSSTSAQTKPFAQSAPAGQVLPLIEKYKAPRFPANTYLDRETYDYRISSHRPVPETLTDVFICDVWQRVDMDLKSKVGQKDVSDDLIKQALNVYLEKKYEDIAGYRPWTHWNFIRGLKPSHRDVLAREITDYIKKNGVRDRDEKSQQKNQ